MANAERLIDIFNEAHARRPGVERDQFLAETCQGEPELMEQVVSLLQAHEGSGDFLKQAILPRPVVRTEIPGDVIGHFKLLEKVGEGGCGAVYVAEQTAPVRRRVALKVIKLGMDTKQVVSRFEAERQALAMMDHPNIAKVFDAGSTSSGRPYFVMELVRGTRITDFCYQNNLSTRERLDLFVKICQAIQHAHQKGIIHRDIKPSNILVTLHDGVPVPKVIDFGIAKATEGRFTEATVYTQLLHFIGTPAYMSPEQGERSGLDIDTRSDIYSLGVLLYELLTGKTPFDGQQMIASGIDAMLKTLRETEPVRPSTQLTRELAVEEARPPQSAASSAIPSDAEVASRSRRKLRLREQIKRVSGDLDWIVMKCLEKDRRRRYETANDLAADLQRHLNNEPVVARPPTAIYKLGKAWRRNKRTFTAAAAVACSLIIGMGVSTWLAFEASRARDAERHHRRAAQIDRDKFHAAQKLAEQNAADTRRNLYAARINLAHQSWLQGNLAQAQATLQSLIPAQDERELRGFEWRYLHKLCQDGSSHTFTNQSFAGARGGLGLTADPGFIVAAAGDTLQWLDVRDDRESHRLLVKEGPIHLLAVPVTSPGTFAYCVRHSIQAQSFSGENVWNRIFTNEICTAMAWSSDASLLASAWSVGAGVASTWKEDGMVRIWDGKSGALIGQSPRLPGGIRSLAFGPGSKTLACGTTAAKVHLLETRDLHERERFESHTAFVVALAFDHSGRWLASGSHDSHIILRDLHERRDLRLSGHQGQIRDLAFSPNGQQLASGGSDHTIRLWNLASPSTPIVLRGHRSGVKSVLFSANGEELYSASEDGEVKVWQAPSIESTNLLRQGSWLGDVAFSPRGNVLAVADFQAHKAVLWDLTNRHRIAKLVHDAASEGNLAFSPDGELLATDGGNHTTEIWDLATSTSLRTFPRAGLAQSIAFHPTKPILAIGSGDVRFWNTQSGEQVDLLLDVPHQDVSRIAFSADAAKFSLGMRDGTVSVWDLVSKGKLKSFREHTKSVTALCFSHDGNLLASGAENGLIIVLDLRPPALIRRFKVHFDRVNGLTFTRNADTLVSTSRDGTIKFLRLDSGQVALTLIHDGGAVNSVAFSPDHNLMATTGSDGNVRLWPATSWAEIAALENSRPIQTTRHRALGQ